MPRRTLRVAALAGCLAAVAPAARGDYIFTDDFNGPSLNADLVDVDGTYFFSAGQAGTTGARSYVRTVEDDYLSIDFQADLIYSMGGSSSGATGVFFGIGSATKDAGYFNEPEAAIYLVDHPDGFTLGYVNSEIAVRVNAPGSGLVTDLNDLPLPDGVSFARITKIGDSLTFEYDYGYSGIFQPDGSYTASLSADAPFLATKSHLFFGTGNSPSRFDRIQVSVIPEPATWGLLAAGTAMLCGLRRRLGARIQSDARPSAARRAARER
jgi:hypothetical protein